MRGLVLIAMAAAIAPDASAGERMTVEQLREMLISLHGPNTSLALRLHLSNRYRGAIPLGTAPTIGMR